VTVDRESSAGSQAPPPREVERPSRSVEEDSSKQRVEVTRDDVAVRMGPEESAVPVPDMGPAADEELRRLSERLRRVEEELDGVFETIGRLLVGSDPSSARGDRSLDVAAPGGSTNERPIRSFTAERGRIENELDDSFERIRRALGDVRRRRNPEG
jgi:hypothetical protein